MAYGSRINLPFNCARDAFSSLSPSTARKFRRVLDPTTSAISTAYCLLTISSTLYDSVQFYQLVRFRTIHKNPLPFQSPPHFSASPDLRHSPRPYLLCQSLGASPLASPAPAPAVAPLRPRPFDHHRILGRHGAAVTNEDCPGRRDPSYSVHHSMPTSANAKIGSPPATAASAAEFPVPHVPEEL